jgi:hypothetical protein
MGVQVSNVAGNRASDPLPAAENSAKSDARRQSFDAGGLTVADLGRQLALDQLGEPLLEPLDLPAAALEQLTARAALLQAAALVDELPEPLDQAGDLWTGATGDLHAAKAAIRPGPTQCGLPEGSGPENRTSLRVV